jgi:hypothetical protein
MSIAIIENVSRDLYQANPGQTQFTVSYPFYQDNWLEVFKRDFNDEPNNTTQKLTLNADYTVTGAGLENGGFITLNVACTGGEIITIIGTEPIDRTSVFDDLNPFTVTMNRQLNDLTIMVNQTNTILEELTPKYRYDELVSSQVRIKKRELPMLNDGDFWVGRGDFGDDPDDIITMNIADFVSGSGGAPSTGTYIVQTSNPLLPDAQALDELTPGIMVTNDDGEVDTKSIVGGTGITVTNGDGQGAGNIVISLSDPSGGKTTQEVTQVAHGLAVRDWIRIDNAGDYVKAQANTANNATVVGVVIDVEDANTFTMQQSGSTDIFAGLTAGEKYFLSPTVAGGMTAVEPTTPGEVSVPVFDAKTTTGGWVICLQRGLVVQEGTAPYVTSGTNSPNIVTVNQPGHGFVDPTDIGKFVRVSAANTYIFGQADTLTKSKTSGAIIDIIDADNFVLQTEGITNVYSGLTGGQEYWLSATTPGEWTAVEPAAVGQVSKPVLRAVNASTAYIIEQRPMLQPNANGGGGGGGGGGGYGLFGAWTTLASGDLTGLNQVIFNNTLINNTYKYFRISFYNVLTSINSTYCYIIFSEDNGLNRIGQSVANSQLFALNDLSTSTSIYSSNLFYGISSFFPSRGAPCLWNIPRWQAQTVMTLTGLFNERIHGWSDYSMQNNGGEDYPFNWANGGFLGEVFGRYNFVFGNYNTQEFSQTNVNYIRIYLNQGLFIQGKYALEGANIGI